LSDGEDNLSGDEAKEHKHHHHHHEGEGEHGKDKKDKKDKDKKHKKHKDKVKKKPPFFKDLEDMQNKTKKSEDLYMKKLVDFRKTQIKIVEKLDDMLAAMKKVEKESEVESMTSYLNKEFQDLGNVISTEIVKNVTSDFEEFDKCLYKTCVLLKGKNYDEVNSRPIVALDHDDLEDSEKIKYLAFLSGLKTWEESKINHEIDFQSLSRQSSLELHGFGQFSPCLTATYMGYSIVEKIVKCETEAIQKNIS